MRAMRKSKWRWVSVGLGLGLSVVGGALVGVPLLVGRAEAVVGRPLTPVSYAGVARRTTRRTVAVGAAAHPYY